MNLFMYTYVDRFYVHSFVLYRFWLHTDVKVECFPDRKEDYHCSLLFFYNIIIIVIATQTFNTLHAQGSTYRMTVVK